MVDFLKSLCFNAIIDEKISLLKHISLDDIEIFESKFKQFGHFQFNNIIKYAKKLGLDSYLFANLIKDNIIKKINTEEIEVFVSKPGFINFKFTTKYISKHVKFLFNSLNLNLGFKNKIILDYSSPNIAKNMHIGHLRSTVVGECISKLLLFSGSKVIKISHLGDWGTQFGLLICYLKDSYKESFFFNSFTLDDLSYFYKIAQEKYLSDNNFKELAKKEVVLLQKKDKLSLKFWNLINNISKKEYEKIYSILNVKINYKGESFYSDLLSPLLSFLKKKNILKISDGAKCIYLDNICSLKFDLNVLIVQKSDGSYNYATTEIACLYYRIKYHNPDKIIYITDIGQKLHFDMIFSLIEFLSFKKKKKIDLVHIGLGLMLNEDGKKIKTRSGFSEKLLDVLLESINISKNLILEKNKHIKNNELKRISYALGINTIKYSDLSNKLDQNYIFDKKIVFKNSGNTASFLMYAYVRICSIKKKVKNFNFKNILNSFDIFLFNNAEIDLALHLIMYKYYFKLSVIKLNPNILTTYVYKLAEKFHFFFNECVIINSDNFNTRFILCELTRRILKSCFLIMGFKLIDKM